MSAECYVCGWDLPYEGPCVVCERRAERDALQAKLDAVRDWARGYPLTDNPDWAEYIKAQHHVEALLSDLSEGER